MANHNRPEKIPGYQHPDDLTFYPLKGDKNFIDAKKKFASSVNTTNIKSYASNGIFIDNEEKCPECGNPPIKTCPCSYSDKICNNGHSWYTDRNGNARIGKPHN